MLPTKFRLFDKLVSEEKIFRNRPIRNKNGLWRPCLLADQDKMSTLYRTLSNDASYQVSIHLVQQFQRRIFCRNQPMKNQKCLWWPYLITDQNEMSSLYRGHAIDASYQVSIYLAKWFQRRRFLEIDQSETRMGCGAHIC